jgi:hypothetical protein
MRLEVASRQPNDEFPRVCVFSGDSYKNDFTDCADYSDSEIEERDARLRGCSPN